MVFYLFIKTIFTVYFFRQDTPVHLYYQILIAYHLRFLLSYCLNALAVILNALSILPLYLFVRQTYVLSPGFWRGFFLLRLSLDLTAHSYDVNFLKSLFHQDTLLTLGVIAIIVVFNLPSYVALFLYAFRQKTHLPRTPHPVTK